MIIKLWDYPNFGDQLNKPLVEILSRQSNHEYIHANLCPEKTNYLIIGSVLQFADKDTIVWGSGFLKEDYCFDQCQPKQILAARGPLTRKTVLKL